MKFSVGDRVRAQDLRGRQDCFMELVLSAALPDRRQYVGHVVRVVDRGQDRPESDRMGYQTRIFAEGTLRGDWPERLTLVEPAS